MDDVIVEEVRTVREAHAKKFNYDVEAIFRDLRRLQREQKQRTISRPPKKAKQFKPRKPLEKAA